MASSLPSPSSLPPSGPFPSHHLVPQLILSSSPPHSSGRPPPKTSRQRLADIIADLYDNLLVDATIHRMYARRQDRLPKTVTPATSDLQAWADALTKPSNRFWCLKHIDLARRELAVLSMDEVTDLSYVMSASDHLRLQRQMLFRAFLDSLLRQTPQIIPHAVSLSIRHDFTSTILDPYDECRSIFMDALASH